MLYGSARANSWKLKLAKRRKVERVRGEAVAVLYRADLIESTFQAVAPGNGDGAVERAIVSSRVRGEYDPDHTGPLFSIAIVVARSASQVTAAMNGRR
jgi:hypothetical protein